MVIKLQFKICQANTSIGEVIKIVGGSPVLGNWLPQDGLILTTNDSIYPQWVSERHVIDSNVNTLEYKYVTYNAATQACFWESIANRIIDLSSYQNGQEYDLMVEDAGFNVVVADAPGKILENTVSSKQASSASRHSQADISIEQTRTPIGKNLEFKPILDLDDIGNEADVDTVIPRKKFRTSDVNPLDQAQENMQVENQQQKTEHLGESFLQSERSALAGVNKMNVSQKCDTTNALEAKRFDLDSFVGNSMGVTFESNSGPSCQIEEIEEFETTTVGLLKDALRECLGLPDWITRSHI